MRAGHLRLLASVAAALLLCCVSASAQLDVNLNRTATAAAAAKESTTARVSAVVADPEIKLADIHHSEIGKKHAAAAAKAAKAAAADDEDDDMYEYDMYDDDDYYGEEESSVSSSGKSAAKAEKPKATPAQPQQVIVKKNTLRTWDLKPIKDVRHARTHSKSNHFLTRVLTIRLSSVLSERFGRGAETGRCRQSDAGRR